MNFKIMEWNIHQQGRQWDGKKSADCEMPLWIIDEIPKDINIAVFTEFNSHAKNIKEFYGKMKEKKFHHSSTDYSCGWSNDIFIAVRGDISIQAVSHIKAYPEDNLNTTFDVKWDTIPENLRVDTKIGEKRVNFWGIRIKDLGGDYEKRSIEMETLMSWLKGIDGLNILVGDFNNLRENTCEKKWNLTVLDELLGADFKRVTPENCSWGVSKLESNNAFDGYIKNDHLIYSIGRGLKGVEVESYNWDFLRNENMKLSFEIKKYEKQKVNIRAGLPDHGILIAEIYI